MSVKDALRDFAELFLKEHGRRPKLCDLEQNAEWAELYHSKKDAER